MKRVLPSRREVLEILGMGTAGLIVGCGDNAQDPASGHAAAILEPESDSFLVALWSMTARTVAIDVQSQDGSIVATTTGELGSRAGAVDITGLEPGTTY